MDKPQRYIYQGKFRLGENSSIPSGFIGPILPLPPSSIFLGHRQLQGGSPGERAVRVIFRCHTEYVSPPTNTTYIKKKVAYLPCWFGQSSMDLALAGMASTKRSSGRNLGPKKDL